MITFAKRTPDLRRLRQLLRPFLGGLVFSLSEEFVLAAASIAARCRGDLVLFYRQFLEALLGRAFAPGARDLADLASMWQDTPGARFIVFPGLMDLEMADKLRSIGFTVDVLPPTADGRGWRCLVARGVWDDEAMRRATTFTPGQCRQMERRLRRHLSQLRTGGVA